MKLWKFKAAYIAKGQWIEPAYVVTDKNGQLKSIAKTKPKNISKIHHNISGYLVPGFVNGHSHAFQFQMAGKAEYKSERNTDDDFWSWRDEMYRLANSITPDQLEKIATRVYKEMLRGGYTHVAEFHYIHHDPSGKSYRSIAEMSERLLSAAQAAGIKMTLLPVFYQHSDFGKNAREDQRRFLSKGVDEYLKLVEASTKIAKKYDANIGLCVHSLRAVDSDCVKEIFSKKTLRHIHISEQTKEVDACLKHLKARPVEWLLDNVPGGETLNLVHATHINQGEIEKIVKTKTNVVLCPTTEGNLGDGIFPLRDFKGQWTIGSDSQINLFACEEIRFADYVQRLVLRKRNVLIEPGQDSGEELFDTVLRSGRASVGEKNRGYFESGASFDGVVLDEGSEMLSEVPLNKMISTYIYKCSARIIKKTIVKGSVRS